MPHAEPPHTPVKNDEVSGTPVLFPPVGNFNAVVPLSEIDADSEIKIDSESRAPALAPLPHAKSRVVHAASRRREQDEQEEATLVPARAARTARASRPSAGRPSWPVMIAALALSLMAGLAAGVFLIKSAKPIELQAPASMTKDASPETSDPQPTQVASDSHLEARPRAETSEVKPRADTNLDASASGVDTEVSAEKTSRGLPAPTRAKSSVAERPSDAERTPERPARKAMPSTSETSDTPAPTAALRPRRAASTAERAPVQRAPERSLPVSSPPSSAKSKRVIQWP